MYVMNSWQVSKKEFFMRTVLLAPPIVTQKRRHATANCHHSSSTKFIELQHAQVQDTLCAYPYACSPEVAEEKKRTLACSGPQYGAGDSSFGLPYSKFQGDYVVTEFLFSLTDNPFLFHGNATIVPRGSFIDSRTDAVNIILVFYSPNEGIITQLTITADVYGRNADIHGSAAMVHYEMVHHVVVEGAGVINCFFSSLLVAMNILIIIFYLTRKDIRDLLRGDNNALAGPSMANEGHFKFTGKLRVQTQLVEDEETRMWWEREKMHWWADTEVEARRRWFRRANSSDTSLRECCTKIMRHMHHPQELPVEHPWNKLYNAYHNYRFLVIRLMLTVFAVTGTASFVVVNFIMVLMSADDADRVLKSLKEVQWDGDAELAHTEQQFFSSLAMLNTLVARNAQVKALGFVSLCINVFALVQCMGVHPRSF